VLIFGLDRLDVLRGIISEVTNAAKSSKPVTTNGQLISMLRKRVKRSESAAAEFHQAKREDLRGKEVKQISMLEEYLPTNNIGDEDITRTIQEVIGKMRTNGEKLNQGIVMKALVGPEGTFDGQNVDKKDVARLVNGLI